MKKGILKLGTVVAAASPVIAVVSCGDSDESTKIVFSTAKAAEYTTIKLTNLNNVGPSLIDALNNLQITIKKPQAVVGFSRSFESYVEGWGTIKVLFKIKDQTTAEIIVTDPYGYSNSYDNITISKTDSKAGDIYVTHFGHGLIVPKGNNDALIKIISNALMFRRFERKEDLGLAIESLIKGVGITASIDWSNQSNLLAWTQSRTILEMVDKYGLTMQFTWPS